jgi:PqqD family protein of HPr-rel-A system
MDRERNRHLPQDDHGLSGSLGSGVDTALPMRGESLWRTPAPDAVVWREWEGEMVVYNHLTGNTHHLNALGGMVLSSLLRHPGGIALSALVHAIADDVGMAPDPELRSGVERALSELAELRLASPRPP